MSLLKLPFSYSIQRRQKLAQGLSIFFLSTLGTPPKSQARSTNRMIVPFEPGGISDALARAVAAGLRQQNQDNWVVENIPGAGGAIGAQRVAQSSNPREYLLHGGAGTFRNYGNSRSPSLIFDPLQELLAVAVIGEMPILCVTLAKESALDLRSYLQQLKNSQQTFVFGAAGLGTSSHVIGSLIAQRMGLKSLIIPYKGSAPTLRGLLSGEIPVAFIDPLPVASLLLSGQLKCLGMSSDSHYSTLQNYSTYEAQGLMEPMALWAGFFVSAKIQSTDYQRWAQQMKQLTQSGFLEETMRMAYMKPLSLFGQSAQRYVIQDVNRFQEITKVLKIQL